MMKSRMFLELQRRLRIEARTERLELSAKREELDQPHHADLDQVDAGALERLRKPLASPSATTFLSQPCAVAR